MTTAFCKECSRTIHGPYDHHPTCSNAMTMGPKGGPVSGFFNKPICRHGIKFGPCSRCNEERSNDTD